MDHSVRSHCESESKNCTTVRENVTSSTPSNQIDTLQIMEKIERMDISMPFEEITCGDDHCSETVAENFVTRFVYFISIPFLYSNHLPKKLEFF